MTQIKLEVGKKYRTRRGEVVGPLAPVSNGCFRSNLARWYPDGVFNRSVINGPYDLIEEVIEPQEPAKEPHKHCELIKAWADGAKIEMQGLDGTWMDCVDPDYPNWHESVPYRIKPEVIEHYYWMQSDGTGLRVQVIDGNEPNVKLTFDGETGELKDAEVIK